MSKGLIGKHIEQPYVYLYKEGWTNPDLINDWNLVTYKNKSNNNMYLSGFNKTSSYLQLFDNVSASGTMPTICSCITSNKIKFSDYTELHVLYTLDGGIGANYIETCISLISEAQSNPITADTVQDIYGPTILFMEQYQDDPDRKTHQTVPRDLNLNLNNVNFSSITDYYLKCTLNTSRSYIITADYRIHAIYLKKRNKIPVDPNKLYLYYLGNENINITGGYALNKHYCGTYGYMNNSTNISKTSEYLQFRSSYGWCCTGPTNIINTTGYSKLCWNVKDNNTDSHLALRLTTDYNFDNNTLEICSVNNYIDLSNYQGQYYVCITCTSGKPLDANVNKIWLEK